MFEAVVAQAAMISELGGQPLIFALNDEFSDGDAERFGDAPLSLSAITGPRQIGFAPDLLPSLLEAEIDCLHLHGIWQYPSRAGRLWMKQTGGAYLISPHGMLDPWITSRGRVKKALARAGYERASWQAATAFHALTNQEAKDIANESGRTDSIIIPNAGPVPAPPTTRARPPEFLYLGRIHPKKNIGALLAAWQDAEEFVMKAGARLTIAGWGDAEHVDPLKSQIDSASATIRFVGPAFGADKEQLLGGSRFLILPSMSEGLPMAVLEAWAHGIPVLKSQECNLPAGFKTGAAIDCGMTAASIGGALREALTMPDMEWLAMSGAASKLARDQFSSESIAGRWAECYLASIEQAHRKVTSS